VSLPQITINKNDPTVVVEVREGSPPADQSALVAQQAQQIQALTSERDAAVQAATAALGERDRAVQAATLVANDRDALRAKVDAFKSAFAGLMA
jgi:hypothetical protein